VGAARRRDGSRRAQAARGAPGAAVSGELAEAISGALRGTAVAALQRRGAGVGAAPPNPTHSLSLTSFNVLKRLFI
jgi:hypothetical protein